MKEPNSETAFNSVSAESQAPARLKMTIQRFRFLVNRFWWIIAFCAALGLIVQGCRIATQPSRYVSVGRMILNGRVNVLQGSSDVYSEDVNLFYGTQVALMKSAETYNESVARVKALHPETVIDESATLDAYEVPKTSVFEVTCTSTDPEYARELVDAAMDSYQANKRGRKDQAKDTAVAAITEEIAKLDADTHRDEQQLLEFQKDNNVVFIEEQSSNSANYLVGLNTELARLTKEDGLLKLEGDSLPTTDNLNAGTHSSDDGASQQANASIVQEQENIEKLKILREQYGVVLKDKHPKMIALADQIDKEERFLDVLKLRSASEREAHRKDLDLQIQNVQAQLDVWNKRSLDLNQRLEIFEQLKAKIAREQNLYNQFAASVQHVDLSKSLDQDEVVTIAKGSVPELVDPNYLKQLAVGLVVGITSGCGLIFLISRLDNRINSPLDFEENFEVDVLGQIPRSTIDTKSKRVPLITENDPRHILGESYRNIRSSILFRPPGLPKIRSLLIASAVPGEGKSTMAANLAVSFAFAGSRTLLIDGDLRRGVLHTIIESNSTVGLSEYLQGEVPWRDAVQPTNNPGLDILIRGKTPRHAGDLFLNMAMDTILQETMAEYDMVVWDSAPILAADDAVNLCSRVDGVLMIVRVGFSTIEAVDQSIRELIQRSGTIIGVVTNAVQPIQPGYRNKYRYVEYSTSTSDL